MEKNRTLKRISSSKVDHFILHLNDGKNEIQITKIPSYVSRNEYLPSLNVLSTSTIYYVFASSYPLFYVFITFELFFILLFKSHNLNLIFCSHV